MYLEKQILLLQYLKTQKQMLQQILQETLVAQTQLQIQLLETLRQIQHRQRQNRRAGNVGGRLSRVDGRRHGRREKI